MTLTFHSESNSSLCCCFSRQELESPSVARHMPVKPGQGSAALGGTNTICTSHPFSSPPRSRYHFLRKNLQCLVSQSFGSVMSSPTPPRWRPALLASPSAALRLPPSQPCLDELPTRLRADPRRGTCRLWLLSRAWWGSLWPLEHLFQDSVSYLRAGGPHHNVVD